MSNILSSEDFGLKLYNRFPPKYREDDIKENFALMRYLQVLSDGGFKYSINEINGLLNLLDPDKVDSKVLPILFKQYGLEIFNGIPEQYLRYLLPKLGEAWSKKGSLGVIEFITTSLSGIKTSTEINYDSDGNPSVGVRLEMDYNIGDYFPEVEHFNRILKNFVPFYCDVVLLYSYLFYESKVLKIVEDCTTHIQNKTDDKGLFRLYIQKTPENSFLGYSLFGYSVFGNVGDKDIYDADIIKDSIIQTVEEGTKILSDCDEEEKQLITTKVVDDSSKLKSTCISNDIIKGQHEDTCSFVGNYLELPSRAVFGDSLFGEAVLGVSTEVDYFEDIIHYI